MGRHVPAVSRAFDILELFIEHETLTAPEITAALTLPRTTVFELVNTLVERSYLLEVGEDAKRFELGPATVVLGQRYQENVDLSRQGQVVSHVVSERCQETVHVGILDEDHVIYVAKTDSSHSVRMVSAIGRRLPAHCTAVGKIVLAGLSPEQFDTIYPSDGPLRKMTDRSISTVAELRAAIQQVRASGIASEYCESNEDVACVAAPVFDAFGIVVAGISISVPVGRWDDGNKEKLSHLVLEGAKELTHRLGGTSRALDADQKIGSSSP